MRLRFSEKVEINVEVPDLIPEKEIPPLLFTSVIENAFKHGISYSNASFINILAAANQLNPDKRRDRHNNQAGGDRGNGRIKLITQ